MQSVAAAGGGMIVDLTIAGMGRRLTDLAEVSRQSGVAIAVGCGYYVEELHPPELAAMGIDEIAAIDAGRAERRDRRHRHPPGADR